MTKKISSKKIKATKNKPTHKVRRQRRIRDKNAPKRPMSAFFCYLKMRRATLKDEQPKLSNTEIISKMSSEWKALSGKEKENFAKMAEKDKERYLREKKNYEEKKKKTQKDDKAKEASPKKPEKKVRKSPKKVRKTIRRKRHN
eukprot:TRINITY_DN3579_c0_g1_i15.p3 TRINITY_DN3579_c0_g1~~TRINITY_DN3579_c0_g1_i15.p3  ORF type:complete len:143 (+),score=75.30 TRINITY_DN3579_c0_g1_i15:128-556(+)